MLNPVAEKLIHDLRYDEHTREHFDIDSWNGKGTCGSVGCIGGTIQARVQGLSLFDVVNDAGLASRSIGVSIEVGNQLFYPWDDWFTPIQYGDFFDLYKITGNSRPSSTYIKELKDWAESVGEYDEADEDWCWLELDFKPEICANAVEQVTRDEMPWVDWKRAFEMEGA